MRKEMELLNARLSGAQTGMDRCVRVAIHGAMYHLALYCLLTLTHMEMGGRASLFGAPNGGGSSTGSRGALAPAAHVAGRAYEETQRTQGLDNGSVLLQQRSVMQRACPRMGWGHTMPCCCLLVHARRMSYATLTHCCPKNAEQDSRLVDICTTVSNLKATSLAINEELREQASMVDSLATDVDKTHNRLRRAEQRSAAMVGAKSETAAVDSSVMGDTTTWTQDNCTLM